MRNFIIVLGCVFTLILMSCRESEVQNQIVQSQKVDSFKIIETDNVTGRECSLTVNYYNEGVYVGQGSYTGSTGCGVGSCSQWRQGMMAHINTHIQQMETALPSGDYSC